MISCVRATLAVKDSRAILNHFQLPARLVPVGPWKAPGGLHTLRLLNLARRFHQGRAISRLGILENLSLKVANHHPVSVVAQDIVGVYWHFASAAGSINHELRNGVAGRMAAQPFYDLNSAAAKRLGCAIQCAEIPRAESSATLVIKIPASRR